MSPNSFESIKESGKSDDAFGLLFASSEVAALRSKPLLELVLQHKSLVSLVGCSSAVGGVKADV